MRCALPVLGLLMFSGCITLRPEEEALPTPYQPLKWDGGYEDFSMGTGRHHIEVKGNAFSSRERITGYFYRRALELCHQENYDGFQVASNDVERSDQAPSRYVASSFGNRWGGTVVAREIPGERRFEASGDIACTGKLVPVPATPSPQPEAPTSAGGV